MANNGELIPSKEPGRILPPGTTFAEGFELVLTDDGEASLRAKLDQIGENERQAAILERIEVQDSRTLVAKPMRADSPSKPEFVGGNLCDPTEVLTPDEYAATELALNSLANARSHDSQHMPKVVVN